MITAEFAQAFAEEWIAAWNSGDLDRILSHYTDDFEMRSPFIVQKMNEPSGILRGKEAIRPYWTKGLGGEPKLHFELDRVFAGADSVAILYRNNRAGMVVEVIFFNEAREAIRGVAHYQSV